MSVSEHNSTLLKHAARRKSESTSLDRKTVHESARFVFCIYYGISIKGVRLSDSYAEILYDTSEAFRRAASVPNYIQMIMSGTLTLQRILGDENHSFESGVSEARQLFELASNQSQTTYADFDNLLGLCCKRANAHLADPKMRMAIGSVTRILARERSDLSEQLLRNLIAHTRAKLAG